MGGRGGGGGAYAPPNHPGKGGSGLVTGRAPANAMLCSHYLHAS